MEYNMKTYITAAEVITALGADLAANVRAIEDGLSGVAERKDPRLSDSPVMAAVIPDETFACLAAQYGGADGKSGALTRTELLLAAVIGSIVSQTGIDMSSADTFIVFSSTTYSIFARADSFAGKPCSIAFIVGAMSKLRNPRAISFLIRDPTSGMYP